MGLLLDLMHASFFMKNRWFRSHRKIGTDIPLKEQKPEGFLSKREFFSL